MAQDSRGHSRFEGHEYPQRVPEPGQIRAGRPAPWADLDASQRRGLTLAHVEARLKSAGRLFEVAPLPVEVAELAVVADGANQPITARSAVLVALFEEDGETRVVLTRRSFDLRHHQGEIALPGGRSDDGESPVDTALREAREEVGLESEHVKVVGWLSPIVTFALGSSIWPIVGRVAEPPELVPGLGEVDRVFTVALSDLLADGAFVEELWRRDAPRPGADVEGFFPIYFFRVPSDLIWGATARILTELLCVAVDVEWPNAQRRWG